MLASSLNGDMPLLSSRCSTEERELSTGLQCTGRSGAEEGYMGPIFVLVHGGGHGGWCWRPTARVLRSHGHEVYCATLTGVGERSHLDTTTVTFETFVTDVVNVLRFEDLHDVVPVGHSMGGIVIPRVAEVVRERIQRVVWLAAAVPAAAESLLQAVPQSRWLRAVVIEPDGTVRTDPEL